MDPRNETELEKALREEYERDARNPPDEGEDCTDLG
jgi:hypothetical protein